MIKKPSHAFAALLAAGVLVLTGCASAEKTPEPTLDSSVIEDGNDTSDGEQLTTPDFPVQERANEDNKADDITRLREISDATCAKSYAEGSVEEDLREEFRMVMVPESEFNLGIVGWYEAPEGREFVGMSSMFSVCSLSSDFNNLEAAYGEPDYTVEIELLDPESYKYRFTYPAADLTSIIEYELDGDVISGLKLLNEDDLVLLDRTVSYGYSAGDAVIYQEYLDSVNAG